MASFFWSAVVGLCMTAAFIAGDLRAHRGRTAYVIYWVALVVVSLVVGNFHRLTGQ